VIEDDIDLADAAGDAARAKALRLRATGLYERAQGYAARLLGPVEVRRELEDPRADVAKARLAKLRKADVPGLFWFTMAWVGRINMDQSDPARIAEVPRAELLGARVIELDERYFDGLPLLMAGGVAAGRPAMFGGDPVKGKELFERGIAVSDGKFLLGRFLYARYYAVLVQDHALYCSLLREVLAAPDDSLPRRQLMNNVSKRWAARWLGRAGDLFAEGGACPAPAPAPGTNVEVDDGSLE
ncbi:MAG: hypothetical protein FJ087_15555, partial [Deltaproteobacteria bacterium]|nr:hypothetical protein [Deltaproteobacteria bacterium]